MAMYEIRLTNELEHHGVKGQKWGVKNGPPWPLSRTLKDPDASKKKKNKIVQMYGDAKKKMAAKKREEAKVKKAKKAARDSVKETKRKLKQEKQLAKIKFKGNRAIAKQEAKNNKQQAKLDRKLERSTKTFRENHPFASNAADTLVNKVVLPSLQDSGKKYLQATLNQALGVVVTEKTAVKRSDLEYHLLGNGKYEDWNKYLKNHTPKSQNQKPTNQSINNDNKSDSKSIDQQNKKVLDKLASSDFDGNKVYNIGPGVSAVGNKIYQYNTPETKNHITPKIWKTGSTKKPTDSYGLVKEYVNLSDWDKMVKSGQVKPKYITNGKNYGMRRLKK